MMAADVPDQVDLCTRKHGVATWRPSPDVDGPRFAKGHDGDAFFYPGVSIYFDIPPGTWDVRLVKHAAKDCTNAYASAGDGEITVAAGRRYTVALGGSLAGTTAKKANRADVDLPAPLSWHLSMDLAPPERGVGFQVANMLSHQPPAATISFLFETKDELLERLVDSVPPDGRSRGAALEDDGGFLVALLFFVERSSTVIAISNFARLEPGVMHTVFLSGQRPDGTGALEPYLTVCATDPANRGDEENGHPLEARTGAGGCLYFLQHRPANG